MPTIPPQRRLGKDGPLGPALGFSLAGLSIGYGRPPPDDARFRILDRAVELGATFWDTSDVYGDSEAMLAQWIERGGNRDSVFLATKGGLVFDYANRTMAVDSTGEYIRRACEASLMKLGVDSIDLYYAHRVNPATPIEETMKAMAQLQTEGKIKYIGLSGVSTATLRRACKVAHVAAVQMEYSPFVLDIEREGDYLATCRELGIAVICYSPLGRGMLSDTFIKGELDVEGAMNARSKYPRFKAENFDTNSDAVRQFKVLAEKKSCTPPQLALAWLLKQGDNIIPIPGTKKLKYLEQNWAALDVELSQQDETDIRRFLENVQVAGDRSTPDGKPLEFIDTVEEAVES